METVFLMQLMALLMIMTEFFKELQFQNTVMDLILVHNYKNWDFSMFWQGSGGNKVFNSIYRNLMAGQYGNHHTDMLNYWTPTNTDTDVPRPTIGDPNANGRNSNRFIESGNYIKLQTM